MKVLRQLYNINYHQADDSTTKKGVIQLGSTGLIEDRIQKIEGDLDKLETQTSGSANFVAQDNEPGDTSVLWVDTDDND